MTRSGKCEIDSERIGVGGRVVIRPRGANRIWTAEFHDHGCHRRKSLRTRRKDIALQRAGQLAVELEQGYYKSSKRSTTIQAAVQAYLDFLGIQGRARRTLTRYRGELRTFQEFASGQGIHRMSQVSMVLLDKYRAWRLEDHDPTTVYHETVVIKQLFKWAPKRDLVAHNPIADYELEKPRRKEKAIPTLQQVDLILAQCTPRRQAEIGMLAFTGMRSGEAQGLKSRLVNLKTRWIEIMDQVDGPTKTRGSVRKVPIHPRLASLLCRLPRGHHKLFFTASPSSKYPEGGRPISTKKLNDYFKAAAKRAGIEGFTCHSLRHFFKTFCVNAGVPTWMVDAWQGHKKGSVSEHYYHVQDEAAQRFMNAVPFGEAGASPQTDQTQEIEQ